MNKRPRTIVNHVVEFVAETRRRRLLVIVGVPTVFAILFDLIANYGILIPLLAVGLATVLYTRSTAKETIAASLYGVGVILIGLFLLELYWNGARGSTEPLVGTATRVLWRAVAGVILGGLGLWVRQIDR
ncbi:hypothetical protein GRX01_04765 [Halobaculum sp. WSA2]|uniref:Uncharacterized protein n=1 Tax=Halobaculum saliterrae TaxID=2073113 RepID=A0A6B0SXH8_9EURY|nr:hypothetical protein [Halobaculum saliterrae]MXR40660.1 hypothetical protein [Halobaculum saliterrae]